MPFNITEFSSSIGQIGIQRTTHYAVNLSGPPALSNSGLLTEIPLRVNSVNLPGANFALDDIKHKGFGLPERRPIQAGFEDIAMTIIADARGDIHKSLHDWFELIFPTNDENVGTDGVEYFEYPNNYYGGLEIYVYDITGKKHTTYTFINPYPTNLGGVQMGWENTDSLMLIPISFTYRSYKKNTSNKGAIVNMQGATAPNFNA